MIVQLSTHLMEDRHRFSHCLEVFDAEVSSWSQHLLDPYDRPATVKTVCSLLGWCAGFGVVAGVWNLGGSNRPFYVIFDAGNFHPDAKSAQKQSGATAKCHTTLCTPYGRPSILNHH